MKQDQVNRWPRWLLPLLFASLILFGGIVATGAYLRDPTPDWRKPVIVLGALALFLGGWTILLRFRRSRSM